MLALVLPPVSLVLSHAAMGRALFADWRIALTATGVAAVVLGVYFNVCGWWAVRMKQRFPGEEETGRKLFFMISVFLLMSGLVLLLIFNIFESIPFFDYRVDQSRFVWAYLGLGFVNIFLSFLMEGLSRFEEWKANMARREQLQKHFQYSQLQGLKNQVNPHFLFNNLNTLSSLIEEDTDAAEHFLDEMSKVYRYLLRSDADQLVTLKTEIRFLYSYFHLLKMRFGDAIDLQLNIADSQLDRLLPPLTLQAIVEEAVSRQAMSKSRPLCIEIGAGGENELRVSHSLHPKTTNEAEAGESRLAELISKYKLLGRFDLTVEETSGRRTITIPFIQTPAAV